MPVMLGWSSFDPLGVLRSSQGRSSVRLLRWSAGVPGPKEWDRTTPGFGVGSDEANWWVLHVWQIGPEWWPPTNSDGLQSRSKVGIYFAYVCFPRGKTTRTWHVSSCCWHSIDFHLDEANCTIHVMLLFFVCCVYVCLCLFMFVSVFVCLCSCRCCFRCLFALVCFLLFELLWLLRRW